MTEAFALSTIAGKGKGAISTSGAKPGDILLSSRPLATVLQPSAKGERCDNCLRQSENLARCTGCRCNFYCSKECQLRDWSSGHKRICKRAIGSWSKLCSDFSDLGELDFLDGMLLIHLLAEHHDHLRDIHLHPAQDDSDTSLATVLNLASCGNFLKPDLLSSIADGLHWDKELIQVILPKFRCNNFEILNGITPFAHGIFPTASSSFNHSCRPNAIPFYHFDRQGLRQDVVAIGMIEPGEEISITYLDPATSYQARQATLLNIYGFLCTCALCKWQGSLRHEDLTRKDLDRQDLTRTLLTLNPEVKWEHVPSNLLPTLHPDFLPYLSEEVSRLQSEGLYRAAYEQSKALDIRYCLVYPKDYFMIGYHRLEMAKLAWNAIVRGQTRATDEPTMLESVEQYVNGAVAILSIGGEGDEPPVWRQEVTILRSELREARKAS